MSRSLTPLVLVQEVLEYRQHETRSGHVARRFLVISDTSCPVERLFSVTGQVDEVRRESVSPDTMTLLVFMYEDLPLVRKIRTDRIVESVRNFN
jgi:hypothetical protein